MKRIRWNDYEQASLHKAMVDIFFVRASTTDESALRGAQQVLPEHRRVKITYYRVYSYKKRIAAARVEADQMRKSKVEVEAQSPEPEPVAHPMSLGSVFETLVDLLVERVTSRVLQAIVERREGSAPTPMPELVAYPMADAIEARENAKMRMQIAESDSVEKRLPALVVVGLQPAQAQAAIAQFKGRARVYTYSSQEARNDRICLCHTAFLMTKFISHATQNRVMADKAFTQLVMVNGGVTDLSRCIEKTLNDTGA